MAFWCIFFRRVLMLVFGILRSASFLMDCLCIAPLTLNVIVIEGFVFQPLFRMALIIGSHFTCFCVRACSRNLSWQYVNSMSCIVWVCEGSKGVECGLRLLVYKGCQILVRLGIGNLFVGMCILWAILGQLVVGWCYWGCLHGLFLGLLGKGVRTLIVNGAMCLCHFCGMVCNWGFGIWKAKRCFCFCGYPCIGHI